MTTKAIYILLLTLAGGASPAVALDMSVRPNAGEMTRLPAYCAVRLNNTSGSPEWNAWRSQIGENFNDIHHYCFALVAVNRYWAARNPSDRGFYLQRALNNFDYIINAAKPDFTLRAEVYSDRGNLYKLMGKPGEAAKDFNQALSANPRIAKPYLQLADLYAGSKLSKRALETVTEGLRHLPDSKSLQRRYLELGGKKPFPEPVAVKTAEPVSPKVVEPAPVPAAAAAPASAPVVSPEATPPAATVESPLPIGTPKNPYCRFCPPE
jgi:tetratricopeptide (TPR) repeat protein